MGSRALAIGMLALVAALPLWDAVGETEAPPASEAAAELPEVDEEPVNLNAVRADRMKKAYMHPVGRRISRYLSAAAEKVDEGEPEEATRLLLKLRPDRLNPFERALVYRLLAFIDYTNENPQGAISHFEKVLGEEVMPVSDEARLRFNIAQLYAVQQNWPQVVHWIKQWLRWVETPDPLGPYLMAIAYYQMGDLEPALEWSRKAVELTDQPQEAWLRLLAALYAQKQDYEKATPVLEELVLRFPKKAYWVQLSLIYGARENYQRSLAVQQVAYAQGLLTEDKELRRLAQGYVYHDLPYEGAKVLEKGLEDGVIEAEPESLEMLANSWIAAREYERSLPPLQRAADLSDDGNLYVRLGQVHMQREQWREAAELLSKAVEKGGLEDPGNATLLLGISYYNDERVAPARSLFQQARNHETTRAEAERWLQHIERELSQES